MGCPLARTDEPHPRGREKRLRPAVRWSGVSLDRIDALLAPIGLWVSGVSGRATSASLGGNVATNAGDARVKDGSPRNQVSERGGLPTRRDRTGGKFVKATRLRLTQLIRIGGHVAICYEQC